MKEKKVFHREEEGERSVITEDSSCWSLWSVSTWVCPSSGLPASFQMRFLFLNFYNRALSVIFADCSHLSVSQCLVLTFQFSRKQIYFSDCDTELHLIPPTDLWIWGGLWRKKLAHCYITRRQGKCCLHSLSKKVMVTEWAIQGWFCGGIEYYRLSNCLEHSVPLNVFSMWGIQRRISIWQARG